MKPSYDEDYDYFNVSVKESISIIIWTSITTVMVVGIILSLAL